MFKQFGKEQAKSIDFIIEICGIALGLLIIPIAIIVTVVLVAPVVLEIRNVLSPTIILQGRESKSRPGCSLGTIQHYL
jgi:uncharacterized membrane protein